MRVDSRGSGTPVRRIDLEAADSGEILLDAEGVVALSAALEDAEADSSCRVIVLSGSPGSFCRGMDIGSITSGERTDLTREIHSFASCLAMIRASERVVISAVDGEAAGGGVGLAAAADICIATARSTFALPELVLGLLPAIILPVLLERLPPQKVRLLCLSSSINSGEALAWGLVDRLAQDPSELEKSVRSATKHCLRCSPKAVAELKTRWGAPNLEDALEAGAGRLAQLIGEEETAQALRAFLDGEPMPWFIPYGPKRESR
ncbi:enoyl-CoA hydratase/isomerase family protein [Gemmatimonadota bacterium]